MAEHMLTLQFKGDRDYLHGTDIFNATLSWLSSERGDLSDIDFAFHRLAVHQLKVVAGAAPEGVEPVAFCSCTIDDVRERFHLVETAQQVMGRYPYPEDEIVSAMEVNLATRRGVLRGATGHSSIETWVAMAKALHYKVFPQLKGKWLFVRGRFPRYAPHDGVSERTLIIVASFNDKITRSEALLGGIKVGEIYFSIV